MSYNVKEKETHKQRERERERERKEAVLCEFFGCTVRSIERRANGGGDDIKLKVSFVHSCRSSRSLLHTLHTQRSLLSMKNGKNFDRANIQILTTWKVDG